MYIYTVIQSIIPSIMLRTNIAHEQSTYQKLSSHDRRYSWSLLVVRLSPYNRTLYRKRERQRCLLNTFSKPHVFNVILMGSAFGKTMFCWTVHSQNQEFCSQASCWIYVQFRKLLVWCAILMGPAFTKTMFCQTGRKDHSPFSKSRILISSILLNLHSIQKTSSLMWYTNGASLRQNDVRLWEKIKVHSQNQEYCSQASC